MSPLQKLSIVAGLVVVIIVAVFVFRGNDAESAINNRLDELEELASKTGPESQFEVLGKAKKAAGYVTETPYLELLPGTPVIGERDDLTGLMASMRGRVTSAEVSFSGRQISVGDSGDSALVNLTVKAKAEGYGTDRTHQARYRMDWRKINGEWLIDRVELLE